jgi:hypothetical protein
MPARAWADFLDAYYRPHLLVVRWETSTDSASGEKLVELLRELIESLRSTADYALLTQEQETKIAFERDLEAAVVRKLLGARNVERGGDEWASESLYVLESIERS